MAFLLFSFLFRNVCSVFIVHESPFFFQEREKKTKMRRLFQTNKESAAGRFFKNLRSPII
ncbi:hypothetical protein COP00_22355 [Bacillus glycinifermentans]|uniref:Uncharacterized protein n=1 Tax=Bacillus glycinifermentans TaxID=1664069 RepID=A0A0T6BNK1_9BACI|nr:hypothetical protein COP00_22355 [Bacillus glycinifermentans]KKB73442.1 hypothetical protein TH62_13215 [Bacillus sp. TH008]KRT93165.1 hypothetical protein AB447_219635 [Bacillus glycinifermentans]